MVSETLPRQSTQRDENYYVELVPSGLHKANESMQSRWRMIAGLWENILEEDMPDGVSPAGLREIIQRLPAGTQIRVDLE